MDGESDPSPDSPKPSIAESKSFFARWAEFYRQDWWGTTGSSPAPERRGLPSPLESPPFPNADWSYGGSPVIGEPDTNSYPLMTAINQARSRTKLYGWIDPTLNFSTSKNSNAPEANDVYSNRFELNQFVLYAERLPDSVQRDHVDWGYHLTAPIIVTRPGRASGAASCCTIIINTALIRHWNMSMFTSRRLCKG